MANRDDQSFRGLEPDHYRRSGLKDAVSHYLSPLNPLTSTAPQPFPNNLTMPVWAIPRNRAVIALEVGWVGGWRGDAVAFRFQSPPVEPCVRLSGSKLS